MKSLYLFQDFINSHNYYDNDTRFTSTQLLHPFDNKAMLYNVSFHCSVYKGV